MALDASSHLSLIAPALAVNANAPLYITAAREELNACMYGANYEKAVAYLAAHTMTLALDPMRSGGAAGAVTSKSEGQLSISYGAGAAGGTDWGQTSYGMALIRLTAACGSGAFVTGGSSLYGC